MVRDSLSSRLGFILLSAGCAIGLGNVWRFPYIVGEYGGAIFVALYIFFLLALGMPIMLAEFAVGRASQRSVASSFDCLEPVGTKWHCYKYIAVVGNYLLMMFYTSVAGWMIYYFCQSAGGNLQGLDKNGVGTLFGSFLNDPLLMSFFMGITVLCCFGICYLGVRDGVERITKWMMVCLFILMLSLAAKSLTLSGGGAGLDYLFSPDMTKIGEKGWAMTIFAAMGQAFFTLGVGVGSLAIFGSYIDKQRSLLGESLYILLLDTFVAILAGLIIFPACFSFDIMPDSGPTLIFITLPNVFNAMDNGRLWGSVFFFCMTIAAWSSVIAVFENIVCSICELTGWSRHRVVLINIPLMIILSLPCILGFNLWQGVQPLGNGSSILELEDFILSGNILPIGCLVYLLFCTTRYGWGWNNFFKEVNTGSGISFPNWTVFYLRYVLPWLILAIFMNGYWSLFNR